MEQKKRSLQGFWNHTTFRAKGRMNDFIRIYKASKSTAILVLFVELYLGLVLVFELIIVSRLVDALIGARAIAVITTDVTHFVWWQIGLFISLLPMLALHHEFEGMVAKLGKTIRETSFVMSTAIVALPISILLVPLMVLAFLVGRYMKHRVVTFILSIAILGAGSWLATNIIAAGAYKVATVGEVLLWAGSLLSLAGYLALRPYLVTRR